jgi:hypothetical protein
MRFCPAFWQFTARFKPRVQIFTLADDTGYSGFMADQDYARCRFSITLQTNDLAIVHCLRALCEHNLKGCRGNIGWGGTGEGAWRSNANQIKLRFTDPSERDSFLKDAKRLLPTGSFVVLATSPNDPAHRQRAT